MLLKICILGCYLSIVFSFSLSHASCVLYRGYHFMDKEDISLIDRGTNGVRSRVASADLRKEDIEDYRTKIKSLQRPWTLLEKTEFKSDYPSPLAELVKLYTNNYKKFTTELENPESGTRRILRLAGLEISVNPFLSMSLKADHAIRYGSGLKLFGRDDLRRYPEYDISGTPKNKEIGFVDIIIIPQEDLAETGAFFVLESFAIGDTSLSHHCRKNLTKEQEVIFPFFIPKKYHKSRMILQAPSLSIPLSGTRYNWLRGINSARTKSILDYKKKELNLIKKLSELDAPEFEKSVSDFLRRRELERVYVSSGFYPQRVLIPDDAVKMRTEIVTRVDAIGRRYASGTHINLDITAYLINPVDRFINAYALRSFGQTASFSLRADIGFDRAMSFESLAIMVDTPNLTRLDISGPQKEGIFPEGVNEDMDYADRLIPLANIHNIDPWRYSGTGFEVFIQALERRNARSYGLLSMNITGQSLNPTEWDELSNLVELEDDNREDDEEAINVAARMYQSSPDEWESSEYEYDDF